MKYPPLNMNIYERNARLYEFLVNMGHIVSPIFVEGTENIKHIYVTVGLFINNPQELLQHTAAPGISSPVERKEISETITSTGNLASTVIKFPSIF